MMTHTREPNHRGRGHRSRRARPENAAGFALSVLLSIAGLFSIGLVIAGAARTAASASVVGRFVFFPLMFLAGLWWPRELMPGALQAVSGISPLGAAVEAIQDSMQGQFPRAMPLLVLAAYAVVFGFLARRLFRWEQGAVRMAQRAGYDSSRPFAPKLAVVTGGGSGMGRELTRQLAVAGCSVAACDLNADTVADTAGLAQAGAGPGVLVTWHACDVADEAQVLRFRDELLGQHARDHVGLVFANAGVGGAVSFVTAAREQWERTFAIDWCGVYHCARVFLPLLMASDDGVLINTSSVNGLWASLGPGVPNTAYSTAKFAVRGFTEALIEDLRANAPQVRVVLVLPGHVGTDIVANTRRIHGLPGPESLGEAELARARAFLGPRGLLAEGASDKELRQLLTRLEHDFKDKAPVSAAQAATIILDGVRSGSWRILIGEGARILDAAVRAKPEASYDYAELFGKLAQPSGS